MEKEALRTRIIASLNEQGFSVNGHVAPMLLNKSHFRTLQLSSRKEQINLQKTFLNKSLKTVEKYLVNGWDVNPHEIDLELRLVESGSIEETLYRWWNLAWWSVPYQKAYGRQIRLLLWDKSHNAPFGLIGLQSPILKMANRDSFLNIPKETLDYWINKSMQAQRLGALPPYDQLIGGKMVSLALTCDEIRKFYEEKYAGNKTELLKRVIEPELLFLTTSSAFGRSSIYNRLKFHDEKVAVSLGYTKGSGSFHIPEALYQEIKLLLQAEGVDTSATFGCGPSRKVKLLYIAFSKLNLNKYHYHNINRELFLFPLVKNLQQVIHENKQPEYVQRPLNELTAFWRSRWALPRFEKNNGWLDFDAARFIKNWDKGL